MTNKIQGIIIKTVKVKESQSQKRDDRFGVSDKIEAFIMELLKNDGDVQLKRNELASVFQCVPSQINYVISTRFSPERGYTVESRRGGGGYIRIRRIGTNDVLAEAIAQIGSFIDYASAKAIIEYAYSRGVVDELSAKLIIAAVSEKSIGADSKARARCRLSRRHVLNVNEHTVISKKAASLGALNATTLSVRLCGRR